PQRASGRGLENEDSESSTEVVRSSRITRAGGDEKGVAGAREGSTGNVEQCIDGIGHITELIQNGPRPRRPLILPDQKLGGQDCPLSTRRHTNNAKFDRPPVA